MPMLSKYKRVKGLDHGSLMVDEHLDANATEVVMLLDNSYSVFRVKLVGMLSR